jgi:hypothetical protein
MIPSPREFAKQMVAAGEKGVVGADGKTFKFHMTIDGVRVTSESFESYSDADLDRGIYHDIALKGSPSKMRKILRRFGLVK